VGSTLFSLLLGGALEIEEPNLLELAPEEFVHGWLLAGAGFIPIVILAPLVEEIVFRGYLYTSVRRVTSPWVACLMTGVLFGVIHGYSLAGLVEVCWMGFWFAMLYEKTGSLLVCILAHALNNLWVVVTVTVCYLL